MVRPNYIPRTLKGVGGVRLFNIPGVIYPEEILKTGKGLNPKTGQAFKTPPPWGISTHKAAKMLNCTPAGARLWLHKHNVRFQIVAAEGKPPGIYWSKKQVQAFCDKRLPLVKCQPKKTISAQQATSILKISRSSLYRYVHKNRLREVQVRMVTDKGTRKMAFYVKAEVKKLAAWLHAVRRHEVEAQQLRNTGNDTHPKQVES